MMPCMCGDTNCPSCGPEQGYNPAFEVVCEWLMESVLADLSPAINTEWLAEELANRLGHRERPQEFADAVYKEAQRWTREQARLARERREGMRAS